MSWLYAAPLRPLLLLAAGASLLLNIAMLVPSMYALQVFDRVFASRSVETLALLSAVTAMALAFAYCVDVARGRALAATGRLLSAALSPAALEQALHPPGSARERRRTELLEDIARLRQTLSGNGIRALFDAPWLPIYLIVIGLMHPVLGLVACGGAIALAVVALLTERLTRRAAHTARQSSRAAAGRANELTRRADVIGGMGMMAGVVAAWRHGHEVSLGLQTELDAASSRLAALARAVRQAVQMIVLGVGAWLVIAADASPGIMVAATILLGRALQPVELLIGGWKQLVDARAAWQRLCAPNALGSTEPGLRLPAPDGRLQVERVVFARDSAQPPVIKGISFSLDAGQSLAIVGSSGCGKSTLARLLLGAWQPRSGTVRLAGADIAQWDRAQLGSHLGYLPQDVSLLSGTIAQNIARFGTVDDAAVIAAARLAHAHELILRLPNGYDTVLGEGGAGLSSGQQRRIGLARALYGQPTLVVLDEPEAHLDGEGEDALHAALRALKALGTTVVMVSHRSALVAQLDMIAVMQEGQLRAFGPVAEVLARTKAPNVHALTPTTASAFDRHGVAA